MEIVVAPNDILNQKSAYIEIFDGNVLFLITDMKKTLLLSGGVGLAAPQVGVSKRIIIYMPYADIGSYKEVFAMTNPVIVESSDETNINYEGCLSFPMKMAQVERNNSIRVKYQDAKGKNRNVFLNGYGARIVQHEIDHLEGITLVEKVGEERIIDISKNS